MNIEIPKLGTLTKDSRFDWYCSAPIAIAMMNGRECTVVVEKYDVDPNKEAFHIAISNFLAAGPELLRDAEEHVFDYFQDCKKFCDRKVAKSIRFPRDVWARVRIGSQPRVKRRRRDNGIYVTLEGGCDWEEEHGLQIVLKNGQKVNKVGPYHGHLANSDAYANKNFENIVYISRRELGWE